jgi:hypothetical protein
VGYSSFNKLNIGCAGDLSYGFTVKIDEFRVYEKALLQSDVTALYQPPINIPVADVYFKFRGDGNNYGTRSGLTTITKNGTSPNFNGTIGGKTCLTISTGGEYVYFPAFGATTSVAPPTKFSLCFWCSMNAAGQETMSICDRGFGGSSSIFQGDVGDSVLATFVAYPNMWTYQPSFPSITFNTWVHVAYVFDQTARTFKQYINGSYINTATGTGGIGSLGSYNIVIGRAGDQAARYFVNCGMHDFMYFSRDLTASEITDIYTNTA